MRITKENLTRYDQHFKSWQRRRLGYGNALENWHQTEEAGAVQFYPVGESPLEGKVKFSFKETPPASGEKSPANPSTIAGVSAIAVDRQSKNLLIYSGKEGSQADLVSVSNDGTITINGTFTGESSATCGINFLLPWSFDNRLNFNIPLGKYILSCNNQIASSTVRVSLRTRGGYNNGWANVSGNDGRLDAVNKTRLITVSNEICYWHKVYVQIYAGTYSNFTFKLQLEQGETATSYDTSDNNRYTIDLGNTYYRGSIDLATGLMTVTWWGHVFDGTESFYLESTDYETCSRMGTTLSGTALAPATQVLNTSGVAVCTHYPHRYDWGDRVQVSFHSSGYIRFFTPLTIASTTAELQAFFAQQYANGTPVKLTYPIASPYTVQLSPLALAALAQPSRHEPRLNTVYTDADSVQITYQKSPIRAATEQEMAILGLGGNV